MHPQTLPCTSPGCTSIEGNGAPFNIYDIFKTYGGIPKTHKYDDSGLPTKTETVKTTWNFWNITI